MLSYFLFRLFHLAFSLLFTMIVSKYFYSILILLSYFLFYIASSISFSFKKEPSMFLSRPLFSLALSVLFGEILLCPELSFSYRFLLFLFYLSYLSMLSRKKKYRIFLLSLFFFCSSSLHFHIALKHFQKQEKTIESLLPFRCRVVGRITSLSENEKTVKILLQNCTIFSSFSAMPETLSSSQKEKWKARNALSFSTLLLYLDKEKNKTSDFPLYPGDILQGKGQFKGLSPTRNEGEFSFLHYCKGEEIEGLFFLQKIEAIRTVDTPFLKVLHRFRKSVSEDLDSLYPEEQSHFLKCLFLGEKASLEKEERNLYREAGISHILAVSGLHLSLLGGGFYSILRVLGFTIAPASLFSSLFILFYTILTGASGSTVRAAAMLLTHFLGKNLGRANDALSSLSLALLMLLLCKPLMLYSTGFQCSFFTLFLLLLLSERRGKEKRKKVSKQWEKAKRQKQMGRLCILLPAFLREKAIALFLFYLGLFPLFSLLQYSFPLYAPLLNLLLLPLLPLLFVLGISSLFFLHCGHTKVLSVFFASSLSFLLRIFHACISFSLTLPHATVLLGKMSLFRFTLYFLFFYALYLYRRKNALSLFPKNLFKLFVLLFPLSLPLYLPFPPSKAEITALYVGQGDGFLFRKGDFVFTIDNGSSSDKHFAENTLIPYCKANRIQKIRYALITHSDIDHTSGIQGILEQSGSAEKIPLSIENLILPVQAREDHRYDILKRLAAKHGAEILYWKNGDGICSTNKDFPFSLSCYYPLTEQPMEEANAHSLGCILRYGNFSMIFTGDMPMAAEESMLTALKKEGVNPSMDIVKLAHHGSKTSSSPLFLSETQGRFALLSYGIKNRYGHPHSITLQKCKDYHLIPLETAKLGEILIQTDGKEYRITAPCLP